MEVPRPHAVVPGDVRGHDPLKEHGHRFQPAHVVVLADEQRALVRPPRPGRPALVLAGHALVDLRAGGVGERVGVASLDGEVGHREVGVVKARGQRSRRGGQGLVVGQGDQLQRPSEPPLLASGFEPAQGGVDHDHQPVGVGALLDAFRALAPLPAVKHPEVEHVGVLPPPVHAITDQVADQFGPGIRIGGTEVVPDFRGDVVAAFARLEAVPLGVSLEVGQLAVLVRVTGELAAGGVGVGRLGVVTRETRSVVGILGLGREGEVLHVMVSGNQLDSQLLEQRDVPDRRGGPEVQPVACHPQEEVGVAAVLPGPEAAGQIRRGPGDIQVGGEGRRLVRLNRALRTQAIEAHTQPLEPGVSPVQDPHAIAPADHCDDSPSAGQATDPVALGRLGNRGLLGTEQGAGYRRVAAQQDDQITLGGQLVGSSPGDPGWPNGGAPRQEGLQLPRREGHRARRIVCLVIVPPVDLPLGAFRLLDVTQRAGVDHDGQAPRRGER